jgi:RNA polymerase sigma factor for flagellar operon FliA
LTDLTPLWQEYKENNSKTAKDKLIAEYTSLVKYTAQRIAFNLPKSVELGDLIGAGVMGLILKLMPLTKYGVLF